MVLNGDPEADQFAWEIDAFLEAEGYTVIAARVFCDGRREARRRAERRMYPDEKDPNIIVIRIGLNDRS